MRAGRPAGLRPSGGEPGPRTAHAHHAAAAAPAHLVVLCPFSKGLQVSPRPRPGGSPLPLPPWGPGPTAGSRGISPDLERIPDSKVAGKFGCRDPGGQEGRQGLRWRLPIG